MHHILPTEEVTLVGVIDPVSKTPGTASTAWISAATHGAFQAILLAGTIAATASLNAKLQQATDSSGTGAKDITGKAITQLGGTDDNKQAIINLKPEDLDTNNGYTYFRLLVTEADSASPHVALALIAGLVQGLYARFAPAAQKATVAQVVT